MNTEVGVTTCYETGDLPQIWGLDHCLSGFLAVLDPQNGDRVDYTKAIPKCWPWLGTGEHGERSGLRKKNESDGDLLLCD